MSAPAAAHVGRPVVAVLFGGQSPEHEVSVISGMQALAAIDTERWDPRPLYLAKDGSWWTGPRLSSVDSWSDTDAFRSIGRRVSVRPSPGGRLVLEPERRTRFSGTTLQPIDIVFPVLHGGSGEDGGLQGLCELLGVPYVGSGVLGSALGMDKDISKLLCRQIGIPVVDHIAIREAAWEDREADWLDRCQRDLGLPVIVKPARLGSSIGISRANDGTELDTAIEEALRYDGKVVVERAVPDLREINCSVLGDPDEAVPSVLEEPMSSDAVLSFRDKYLKQDETGGTKSHRSEGMASLDRMIPAPLDDAETASIRELAVRIFRAFECAGVARIDFLREGTTGRVYFNEINTIPGSLSFYLWEPTGIPFSRLVDRLLEIALAQHHDRTARVRSYAVNLLSEKDLGGLKGSKGS